MSEQKIPIPAMLYNSAVGGHVTNSQQIIDENLNREQNDINQETVGAVPYNSTTPNGMGRIVLKKNDNFKTVVEAQTNGNTIFVIKYDFTLTGNVTIPANCVLEFDGGSISGAYTITGANTSINAGLVKVFNTNVTLAGTWNVNEAYPEWFGAKGDGVTDDAASTQKTVNFAQLIKGTVKFSNKKYAISSITISEPVRIIGTANKNAVSTDPAVKELWTAIVPISTSLPCFKLSYEVKTGGIIIKDLFFIHNVSELTVLPYVISDQGSTLFASGIIIENIMFKNAYNGIRLHHAERFTIRDINGDFANNFLDVDTIRDVSIIDNIHIHNFSGLESYTNFKRSTSSDFAIKMNVVDEIFMTNIFIWDRHKGISFNKVWGTVNNITVDGVNKLFYIGELATLGLSIQNIHYMSGLVTSPEEFNVIDIVCNTSPTNVETRVSIKNADFRMATASPNKIFNINCLYPVTIDNVTLGFFTEFGIYITSCKCGIFNNIRFVYSGTIDPSENKYLGYNIVNNDSVNKMIFNNIISESGKKLYDGYYKNVEFDKCISLTSTVYASNGAASINQNGTLVMANNSILSNLFPKCCYPSITKNAIVGVVYKVLETLNNNAVAILIKIGNTNIYNRAAVEVSSDYRISITKSGATGAVGNVRFQYISQGQMLIKNAFIGESNRLGCPDLDGDNDPYNGLIGDTFKQWVRAGQIFVYDNKLYFCKTDGFPNTDDNSIAVKIADI